MHALLIDDVQLVGHLVELEAPLVEDVARLLIVLRHLGRLGRRTMVEIPHELPVARELQDAVLIGFAADPHEPFRIDDHGLQLDRPLRVKAGAAPCADDVALLVGFDELGSTHAAERGRGVPFGRQLDGEGGSTAVEEPDVIHVVDKNPHDLLHAPLVRQRLGPERVDAVLRCAVVVHCLSRDHLRVADAARGKRRNGTQNNEGGSCLVLRHTILRSSFCRLGPCLR